MRNIIPDESYLSNCACWISSSYKPHLLMDQGADGLGFYAYLYYSTG